MTYIVQRNGSTATSSEINANFLHVGQGDFLPMSGVNLSLTSTQISDLGSPTAAWNRVYVNSITGAGPLDLDADRFVGYELAATNTNTGVNWEPYGTALVTGTAARYKRIEYSFSALSSATSITHGIQSARDSRRILSFWTAGYVTTGATTGSIEPGPVYSSSGAPPDSYVSRWEYDNSTLYLYRRVADVGSNGHGFIEYVSESASDHPER